MTTSIEIQPNTPSQSFSITLEERSVDITISWNSRASFWSMSISENDSFLIRGIALKVGLNLLEQYNFELGALLVVDVTNSGLEANLSNINSSAFLIHFTQEEWDEQTVR